MNGARLKAELYKVKREIIMHGSSYDVYRVTLDEYRESTDEETKVTTIRGLFHTSKGYISEQVSDGTKTHTKGQPKLLVEFDKAKEIENSDFVLINAKRYRVIEQNNIQEYNIVTDISLELVLNGRD